MQRTALSPIFTPYFGTVGQQKITVYTSETDDVSANQCISGYTYNSSTATCEAPVSCPGVIIIIHQQIDASNIEQPFATAYPLIVADVLLLALLVVHAAPVVLL